MVKGRKQIQSISEVEAAYIAGLIDGEGSFNIGKCDKRNKKHSARRGFVWEIRVSIGMSDTEGLELVKEKSNKKRLRVSKNKKGHKTMYYLTLFSGEIRQIIPMLLPFLRVKKKQAELILEAATIIPSKANLETDRRLEEIRNILHNLNCPNSFYFHNSKERSRQ